MSSESQESGEVNASAPRGAGSFVRKFLLVVVPLVVAGLAGYALYAEAVGFQKTRYPLLPAGLSPTRGMRQVARDTSGAAKLETERLGAPGSPIVVQALLLPKPCSDPVRKMLREQAERHKNAGLYVEIYNKRSPEGRELAQARNVNCASVWVNQTEYSMKNSTPEAIALVRTQIEKAVVEKAESTAPGQTNSGIAKKGA